MRHLPVKVTKSAVHFRSVQEGTELTQGRDEYCDSRMETLFKGPLMASQEQGAAQML